MLSLERGFGANTVLSVNYVGTQGHRLLVITESNPGDPALCLALSNPANLAPARFLAVRLAKTASTSATTGQVFNGTRGPLGSNFGSNANQTTIGNSNYNALQVTLRHTGSRLSSRPATPSANHMTSHRIWAKPSIRLTRRSAKHCRHLM